MQDLELLSDEAVAFKAKTDKNAFGVLYVRYEKKIFHFIFPRIIRDSETARDLVQQSMYKALCSIDKFDVNRKWKTWVYSIAIKESYTALRKPCPKSLEECFDFPGQDDLQRKTENTILLEKVKSASQRLPPLERKVFTYIYLRGWDEKKTSEALGVPLYLLRRARLNALNYLRVIGSE